MIIKLIEPLGVNKEVILDLGSKLEEKGHTFVYYSEKTTDIEELISRVADADILMIANGSLPDEVINTAKNLKYISVAFTGIDHIGKEACIANNILVSNSAGYSDISVAELVIGLTLDLYRNISRGNDVVRKGGTISGLIGNEIRCKTVGIIGTGRIGKETAKIFNAFGVKLLGYDLVESEEAKEIGIKYVDLDTVLSSSDIVSLHVPNIESTKAMINADSFKVMKSSAILINCARGPVVDNVALANALNNDVIAGAGIDVFDMEPPIPSDYPLLSAKNTVLTPHVAYASEESMVLRAKIVFNNVEKYLEGNQVNVMKLS